MAGEQFSLCWDNFHKNMSSGMHSLLESGDLVDVTLAVEGKYLKAHKMVLSVCSPYFRELFQNNPCKHPIMFMKDVSYIAMSDLLTFMYQGEVQVNQENLATFIKTAEALQIKGLTGDGNGEISDVSEEIQIEKEEIQLEKPTKRTIEVSTEISKSTQRPRKLSSGVKRPKLSTPVQDVDVSKEESMTVTPSVQFKMEPYESVDQTNIENIDDSQAETFGDETLDDSHMEDTEDYSMLEGEDPQVGTSGDGMGDSQELTASKRPETKHKKLNSGIVVDGFVYHQNSTKNSTQMRYLVCSEYKRLVCRARAMLPKDGTSHDLILTRGHNHPPIWNAEEKATFLRCLKDFVESSPSLSLRKAYESTQILYPEGANMCPFNKIIVRMKRWRRESSNK